MGTFALLPLLLFLSTDAFYFRDDQIAMFHDVLTPDRHSRFPFVSSTKPFHDYSKAE